MVNSKCTPLSYEYNRGILFLLDTENTKNPVQTTQNTEYDHCLNCKLIDILIQN